MDYYKVLEISEQADEEQIKQAYRKQAKKYHPDLHPNDAKAEEKFKDVVEAYEVLGDAAKRKEYDAKRKRTGDYSYQTGFPFGGKQPMTQQNKRTAAQKKNPLDVTEMFEAFMKIK